MGGRGESRWVQWRGVRPRCFARRRVRRCRCRWRALHAAAHCAAAKQWWSSLPPSYMSTALCAVCETLCPALPCPALPCPALPCPALPCPALPCPALPCPALPCPALPCPALPCPALPQVVALLGGVCFPIPEPPTPACPVYLWLWLTNSGALAAFFCRPFHLTFPHIMHDAVSGGNTPALGRHSCTQAAWPEAPACRHQLGQRRSVRRQRWLAAVAAKTLLACPLHRPFASLSTTHPLPLLSRRSRSRRKPPAWRARCGRRL